MSWDTYVHQICNTYDAKAHAWSVTNVCQYACIYGMDGAEWSTVPGFQLAFYNFNQEQEDGSFKEVPCNELNACIKAAGGDRKGGQGCGIRMCNQKYMFVTCGVDGEVKYCVLTRQGGGGACIAKTR